MQKLLIPVFLLLVLLGLENCTQQKNVPDAERGATLARIHCTSCHTFSAPELLPKATWEQQVLPRMGYRLGIYEHVLQRDSLVEQEAVAIINEKNIYPTEPQLTDQEWADIQAFYLAEAPETLEQPAIPATVVELPLFSVRNSPIKLTPPRVTMAQIQSGGGFFIGDANEEAIYQFEQDLTFQQKGKTGEGAVTINEFVNTYLVTVMGSFSPTDAAKGLVVSLPKDKTQSPRIVLEGLQRPVHTSVANFWEGQNVHLVISEFAKWTGKLALWSMEDGKYVPTVLKDATGAIRSIPVDLNADGLLDIVALFGQGAEGIYAFYNQGDHTFKEEPLLTFPASYGSSYFAMMDLDADNDLDIIYTNGDNADYPPVLKPYHGIRFYMNDGGNNFSESFFYPLYGAYKAIPADFDQDGDTDIAAISFFPDFENRPERSFVYLENQGDGELLERTFPEVNIGRWITMDAGDVDLDGDLDIILGSLAFEVVPPVGLLDKWVEAAVPFVVLENGLK
jgi:hypothetical protein